MRKTGIVLSGLFFLMLSGSPGWTAPILFDWAYNVDGVTSEACNGDSMPVTGTLTDGLGTLTWTTNAAGSHNFISFLDYEIDEELNTFFNETGSSHGALAAGQSWEIDEPGYSFGNIYTNVLNGSLDNSNGLSGPEDVSWALGWNFALADGETALISMMITDQAPVAGFYLSQLDPDSNKTLYLASTIAIHGGGAPVPEPATLLLLGSGMVGLFGFGRKRLLK